MEPVCSSQFFLNRAYTWAAQTSGIQKFEKLTAQSADSTALKVAKVFAMSLGSLVILPMAALIGVVHSIVKCAQCALCSREVVQEPVSETPPPVTEEDDLVIAVFVDDDTTNASITQTSVPVTRESPVKEKSIPPLKEGAVPVADEPVPTAKIESVPAREATIVEKKKNVIVEESDDSLAAPVAENTTIKIDALQLREVLPP